MATITPIASNRKALHDFEIVDRLEVGIVLTGTEIKSIRTNGASIREAYARKDFEAMNEEKPNPFAALAAMRTPKRCSPLRLNRSLMGVRRQ